MAKAIRWQIPFMSVTDKHYRIDIYDEGWTGSITTLTAGPNPFTTDEDASDDFFAPIRTQTGNIEVCTALPDGGMLTLDEILPASNIARPVRLINTDSSTIEWQGFLSCEAYSQEYVGTPQILNLPVISVLEAMGSVEIEMTSELKFGRIIQHVVNALNTIQEKSGMQLFTLISIPQYLNEAIVFTSIYNNVYFRSDEVVSGENIIMDVHSISCKEILSQIAQFYGAVWREARTYIFLHMPDNPSLPMQSISFPTAVYYYLELETDVSWGQLSQIPINIADLEWRGTGHQRSVSQGKRRIKISADLKDFECDITMRECPIGTLVENPEERQSKYGEVHANTNSTFYNMAEHRHILARASFASDGTSGATLEYLGLSSSTNYLKTIFWSDNDFRTYYKELVAPPRSKAGTINIYPTSYMCWWRNQQGDLVSGLMLCGYPKNLYYAVANVQGYKWTKFALNEENYIFKQSTPLVFSASQGFLRLQLSIAPVVWNGFGFPMSTETDGKYKPQWYENYIPSLTVAIRVGNKWVRKYKDIVQHTLWLQDEFTTIDLELNYDGTLLSNWLDDYGLKLGISEEPGIYIPINNICNGVVTIYFYPEIDGVVNGTIWTGAFEVMVNSFKLEYMPLIEELKSDRSNNSYITDTGALFKEELEVPISMASDALNNKRATMIWSSASTPKSLITFDGTSVRPELKLLDRMKAYYQKARQSLSLEVLHPDYGVRLPQMYFNGINDGKVYAPLAESRDWKEEISTLTCFETPNE